MRLVEFNDLVHQLESVRLGDTVGQEDQIRDLEPSIDRLHLAHEPDALLARLEVPDRALVGRLLQLLEDGLRALQLVDIAVNEDHQLALFDKNADCVFVLLELIVLVAVGLLLVLIHFSNDSWLLSIVCGWVVSVREFKLESVSLILSIAGWNEGLFLRSDSILLIDILHGSVLIQLIKLGCRPLVIISFLHDWLFLIILFLIIIKQGHDRFFQIIRLWLLGCVAHAIKSGRLILCL